MDQEEGLIESIVFQSEETGFTVAKIRSEGDSVFTVVGTLGTVYPGEWISFSGDKRLHKVHGLQYEIKEFSTSPPRSTKGIQKYLESGAVKGIGKTYAKKIVKYFKEETLSILDDTPQRLTEIPGIGAKRIAQISKSLEAHKGVRNILVYLRAHNVSASLAQKLYAEYGAKTIELIKKNPYALVRKMRGLGFKTADSIAESIGICKESSDRIAAGLLHILETSLDDGNTTLPLADLIHKTASLLSVPDQLVPPLIPLLLKENLICEEELNENKYIWLTPLYKTENGICREIERLISSPSALRAVDTGKALYWVESRLGFSLAENQKKAISSALEEKLLVITGGPGTGKSTITKAILEITSKITKQIKLCAPTGKAAKRMTEITKCSSSTIHSLLEFDFSTRSFKRNSMNPIEADLLIIDEASMIDTFLLYNILKATASTARIIFVGDIDQLPSVGPGNILKDLIASNVVATSRLNEIFRQAKGSHIVINAHRINEGKLPYIHTKPTDDFQFIETQNATDCLSAIVSLLTDKLKGTQINPIEDVQVLSPMRKGVAGIESLNKTLQNALNPNGHTVTIGQRLFRIHDKVMQTKNNYDTRVFNGEMGRICEIDSQKELVTINFDGKIIECDYKQMDEIVLAYAVSIHKYQGSECPHIIIPVDTSHFKLLCKNLLYTGITRGKKSVVVVGSKKALAMAVQNDNVSLRHTGLTYFLQKESTQKKKQLPF